MKLSVLLAPVLCIAASTCPDLKVGSLTFDTNSTRNGGALRAFVNGLRFLHVFWYDLAIDCFKLGQELDPMFAISYWGEVMAYKQMLWSREDIVSANLILNKISDEMNMDMYEKGLIESAKKLFDNQSSQDERMRMFAERLEQVAREYPSKIDAAALLALARFEIGTKIKGKSGIKMVKEARARFRQNLEISPNHTGLLHYYVHSCDFPDPRIAKLAIPEGLRLAELAPDSSHAMHMVTHLLVNTGDWEGLTVFNLKSWEAGNRFCGHQVTCDRENRYHSLEWIQYGYLQQGKLGDAMDQLKVIRNLVLKHDNISEFRVLYSRMRTRQLWQTLNLKVEVAVPGTIPFGTETDPYWAIYTKSSEILVEVVAENLSDEVRVYTEFSRLKTECQVLNDEYLNVLVESDRLMAIAALKKRNCTTQVNCCTDWTSFLDQAVSLADKRPKTATSPTLPNIPVHELYGIYLLQIGNRSKAKQMFQKSRLQWSSRYLTIQKLG